MSKLTLGLRNTLDSKEKLKADAKYKSNDLSFEFQESNNNNYTFENNNNSFEEFANTSMIANYEVMEDYENNENNNDNNNTSSTIMFSRKSE